MLFLFNETQISGGVFCNLAPNYMYFQLFETKARKKTDKAPLIQFQLFILYESLCLQKEFHGRLLSIRVFSADRHYIWAERPIVSHDQFEPIRIGEDVVVNHQSWEAAVRGYLMVCALFNL